MIDVTKYQRYENQSITVEEFKTILDELSIDLDYVKIAYEQSEDYRRYSLQEYESLIQQSLIGVDFVKIHFMKRTAKNIVDFSFTLHYKNAWEAKNLDFGKS